MLYTKIAKPLMFKMDPEQAHHLTIRGLQMAAKWPGATNVLEGLYGIKEIPALSTDLWGLHFPQPIGLAAGLDKNGVAVSAFSSMGFGFVEAGTVTPEPQPGNERPRLFRLPDDQALVNRMGFNNDGARAMAEQLKLLRRRKIPIAVNIGKNKWTPNEQAAADYRECLRILYPHGDFFVVNISSPNTPDLRKLQHGDELLNLLREVKDEMNKQAQGGKGEKPVLVKIAPDVTHDELKAMMGSIAEVGVSGIIATNTTIRREGLTHVNAKETGGLSGKPLTERSTEVIRTLYRLTEGKLPIIGCGGIFSSRDAYEKIRAGASMVEIYTAFIYHGPGLNRMLHQGLYEILQKDGYTHISQAVGTDV